jgi:hypothetical protein
MLIVNTVFEYEKIIESIVAGAENFQFLSLETYFPHPTIVFRLPDWVNVAK